MQQRKFSDRYKLEEHLETLDGVDLYRATDLFFPRKVSVAVFSNCDPAAIDSFKSRTKSFACLSHHNIISIYDMESEGNSCYLISEYRNCPTLREQIENGCNFSLKEALSIALDIATAIAHAHQQDIVHGQLTSDMILIENTKIKVTFLYPDAIRKGKRLQKQDDIFALGNIMNELIALTPSSTSRSMRSKVEEIIDRLKGLRPPVYNDVSDLAYDLKMMLIKDLSPYLGNQQQTSEQETRPYQIVRSGVNGKWVPANNGIRSSVQRLKRAFIPAFAVSIFALVFGIFAPQFMVNHKPGVSVQPENNKEIVSDKTDMTQGSSEVTIIPVESAYAAPKDGKLMPEIVGLHLVEAENLLLSSGLRYTYYIERSDKPSGTVFKVQQPDMGFKRGDRVVFYISSGK